MTTLTRSPILSASRYLPICCFLAVFLAVGGATAGTLIFPQGSSTWGSNCDNGFGSLGQAANSNGCNVWASFSGGQFFAPAGVTKYVISPGTGSGCGHTAYVSFSTGATDFAASVEHTLLPGEHGHELQVLIHDTDPDTGLEAIRTTRYPLNGQALSISGSGYSIGLLELIVCIGGDCTGNVGLSGGFAIASMAATQPVLPTVNLSTRRNGDGTYSAVIDYSFSFPGTLSLSLLPTEDEPAVSYFSGPAEGSGTTIVPVGSFDTDRMLQVIATGCEGSRTAQASVSGCGQCKGPAKSVGGPVRLFDGVMTYSETDPLPATLGLEFRREYSSGAAAEGRFGKGWASIFDASAMVIDPEGKTVAVVNEDRTRTVFRFLSGDQWYQTWPKGGASGTLTGSETSGYAFRDAGGSIVRTFGANHRLTRLQDLRRGRAVSITYDANGYPTAIADEGGNWSCTVMTANGHVTGIAVDGRPDLAWAYAYTGSLLTSVSVAGAPSAWRTYEYTNNRLSAIRDASNSIIERHDYDAFGRATSSYDATGDITTIQYPASDANGIATTAVTRADSSQATYTQAFAAGEVVTQRSEGGCSSCGTNDATASYDTSGNLTRLQNGRGYVTLSAYDPVGRHLIQTTTAMKPSGCNPETDPAHCRLSSAALATTAVDRTAASQDATYSYADPNWPAKPTRITRNSVLWSGVSTETFTFDSVTGETLVHTISGAVDSAGTQEVHTTTSALYDGAAPAAFAPGGAFQSAWLTLPQPAGLKKSVDGPRTDVTDVTTFVYYPFDNGVPGPWRGRPAAIRDALGHISRFEDYNVFGAAEKTIDANGVVTRLTLDAMGRVLTSTVAGLSGCDTIADPLCATDLTTTRTYSSTTGALASEQRPAGNVTTYDYDTRGRLLRMNRGTATTPLERIEYAYDPTSGKKSSETMSTFENNAWVVKKSETYTYTSDGNLSSVVHADTTRQLFAYLADGTLSSVQDENHSTPNTVYAYDPAGHLSTVTQTLAGAPGGQVVTRYAYDVQGNLTSVTDPNGNVTTYVYDDFGRMQRQTSPVSGVTTYTYHSAGNVLTTTDANGAATTRSYDAINRVLSSVATRSSASETVSWTYDDTSAGNLGVGRPATMTDPTGSTVYRYERRGLLQSEAKTIAGSTYTTSFAYDANGNRNAMSYPNGIAARYTFDFADRPYSLMNGAASIVSSAMYLPFGPPTSLAFGNGTTRTMRYDARYRPLENKLTGPGGTIADYNYAEDNNGNITQIHDATDATYNRDFGYDDLNRLTTANSGTALWGAGSYTYDGMGNMVSSSLGTWKSTTSTFVGTTPKLNSVVENGISRAVAYDAFGNETAVGTLSSAYSPRNALASADTSAYVYDGRGVLTIATVSVLSLNVAPSSVTGGAGATGTVTLSAPAAVDTQINLTSSNPPAAGVPSSVVIAAGSTMASFTVMTQPVVATADATITVTFNQYAATTLVLVVPADLSSITLSPSTITGGDAVTGTITLSGSAATNLTISLSSNNSAASVPASVTVAAGSASATFPITTTSGVTGTTAVISATLNATTLQATLVFADAELSALSISPGSILNGNTAVGTVTLTGTANVPVVISLSRSSANVFLPVPNNTSVTVPVGASSATFTIMGTLQTTASATVTITASHSAVTRQATITVNLPWVSSFTISPQTLVGGNNAIGTATINAFPPANGTYNVTFTSTNTSLVATPKTINYSNTSGQTTIFTNPVLSQTPVVVTAHDPTSAATSQTVTLQPAPVTLSSFALNPTSVVGSNDVTATVTLTAAAPTPGIDVDIRPLPDPFYRWAYAGTFVHVPTGSTTANFTITTFPAVDTLSGSVSLTHSATTKSATLTVQGTTPNHLTNLIFYDEPDQVQLVRTGGVSGTGTVYLQSPATGGGFTVTLATSNTAVVSVPSSIKVPKGGGQQTFAISTFSVASPVEVTLTATGGGTHVSRKVIVLPTNGATVASVVLYSSQYASSLYPGQTFAIGNVTLTGPAPSGGVTITMTGSRPDIMTIVDISGNPSNTITIPAGATSGTILARIYPFTGIDHATTISATVNGISRSGIVTFTAIPQALLQRSAEVQCASLSIASCLTAMALQPSPLSAGDTTGYTLYTPELRLLAETEITAASTKSIAYSYLWFGDLPVASIEAATNTTRWYATDHLGTPLVMTDAGGVVIWRAEYAPYGAVFSLRTGASLHQPLRFPGQIAQDGTETYYNVFRHYRSSWGRYTQPDPIALKGGINLFAYVAANPIVRADQLGLKCSKACPDCPGKIWGLYGVDLAGGLMAGSLGFGGSIGVFDARCFSSKKKCTYFAICAKGFGLSAFAALTGNAGLIFNAPCATDIEGGAAGVDFEAGHGVAGTFGGSDVADTGAVTVKIGAGVGEGGSGTFNVCKVIALSCN